ncbi:TIR domain-containing protein [Hymenobacter sp. B81]|uniref:TIR domain-containing protein n=1 Tax=Hymenobacter sp. B81 TaxID=3344878 RepID=UPI0037DCB739
MARNIYFSFHYQRDIFRVQVVRNSWVCYPSNRHAGYFDRGLWEKAKTEGDAAIRRLIDNGMQQTGVTVVLIGAETASRPWVRYEIERSIELSKGLLGIRIHGISSLHNSPDYPGSNPFDLYGPYSGNSLRTSYSVPVYDWIANHGYQNFGSWVEQAALRAGR